mmetsp:Transcript_68405/g.154729  ORF Transcript_68405/g.154729 Transcript_68405/m.154729 type:complete len:277 (+) Transcript_68405:34-864(+)
MGTGVNRPVSVPVSWAAASPFGVKTRNLRRVLHKMEIKGRPASWSSCRGPLLKPHAVVAVAAGGFVKVVLVVFVRGEEVPGAHDGGLHRLPAVPLDPSCIEVGLQLRLDLGGDPALLLVVHEDHRGVLRPRVVPLLVQGGRVVEHEEEADQVLVQRTAASPLPRIGQVQVQHLDVARLAAANLAVRRVGLLPAHEADSGARHNAALAPFLHIVFRSPVAPGAESCPQRESVRGCFTFGRVPPSMARRGVSHGKISAYGNAEKRATPRCSCKSLQLE